MIGFAWLQSRLQTLVVVAGLLVVAVVLAVTGPHLVHLYHTEVAHCSAYGNCPTATASFLMTDGTLRAWLDILIVVVPGIIGIFWGAPLVARELEAGTYRLAWTQSVTRTRWLAAKLAVVGLASVLVTGLLSLFITWWASPLDRAQVDLYATFDQRDLVPVGYAALAFALGVVAGVLIRRTLPAMAATMVAFVAARIAFDRLVRPNLFAPRHHVQALQPAGMGFGSMNGGSGNLMPNPPHLTNAWITSNHIVDDAGRRLTPTVLSRLCPDLGARVPGGPGPSGRHGGSLGGHAVRTEVPRGVQDVLFQCVTKVGTRYHEVAAYQPASRYWAFQWTELGLYVVAAAVLVGACFWLVRRRIS